jgi:hypothetical protein
MNITAIENIYERSGCKVQNECSKYEYSNMGRNFRVG